MKLVVFLHVAFLRERQRAVLSLKFFNSHMSFHMDNKVLRFVKFLSTAAMLSFVKPAQLHYLTCLALLHNLQMEEIKSSLMFFDFERSSLHSSLLRIFFIQSKSKVKILLNHNDIKFT